MAEAITVIKLDEEGEEKLRYQGVVLDRGRTYIKLEARFQIEEVYIEEMTFRRNDRFIEWFYTDRWYNVFEIHDREDDHLKGWYCNFTRPALIEDDVVSAEDLALDLLVYPDGDYVILDQDEYKALDLSQDEKNAVRRALDYLKRRVEFAEAPFDSIRF